MIPTQNVLNYSIPYNEVKVLRSFILRAMKVDKTYEVFWAQF